MDPTQNPNTSQWQSQIPFTTAGDGSGSSGGGGAIVGQEIVDNKKKKKLLHRDIERQRRQEMASLFASLRTHLPLQYIKGKRAVSDHVNGAVNFINDTQKRIQELRARKEELSREVSSINNSGTRNEGNGGLDAANVMVQTCVSGFEVVVSSKSSGPKALPLSRVFEALNEQGLEVISSLTTKVNDRLMHTIQVEVNSFGCLDLAWLQQKLIEELIGSSGY